MFSSLVNLESTKTVQLNQQVIEDLNIEKTYQQLLTMSEGAKALIDGMCMDIDTILFRQEMMKDFLDMPGLLSELYDHLSRFDQFRFQFENELTKASRLYYLIDLLLVVEASVMCLEDLHGTLHYYPIKAPGLLQLKKDVETMMATKHYVQMKKDMKAIRYIFRQIKSVEVSVNMNTGMRPYEAQITKVNEHGYRFPEAFRKVSDALEMNDRFLGRRTRHYVPVFPVDRVNLDLLEEVEYALRDHKGAIKDFLAQYNKIDATPFIRLHEEITFYMASYDLVDTMTQGGLYICWPKLLPMTSKSSEVIGGYNLHLGKRLIKEGMVTTLKPVDFMLDNDNGVVVLTGSNRGGKTTFTQMMGQVQFLAQMGLPVPAKKATVSLVDRIVTHFPKLEKESVDYGRFGKACEDFSKFYEQMTSHSLLLMNESFSGTSHLESLEIASEVVRALCHLRVRCIYNTHLHELMHELGPMEGATSYVVGEPDTETAFSVYQAQPQGYSHAMLIAKRFGVTYEQLIKTLEKEGDAI